MKARNVALLMLTGALLAGGAIVVKRARTPALEVAATLPRPSAARTWRRLTRGTPGPWSG